MPIGRLNSVQFGRFVSGKYRFLKCADFEACPSTQSINQPSNNMGVRRLWSQNGVRRLRGMPSYCADRRLLKETCFRWSVIGLADCRFFFRDTVVLDVSDYLAGRKVAIITIISCPRHFHTLGHVRSSRFLRPADAMGKISTFLWGLSCVMYSMWREASVSEPRTRSKNRQMVLRWSAGICPVCRKYYALFLCRFVIRRFTGK